MSEWPGSTCPALFTPVAKASFADGGRRGHVLRAMRLRIVPDLPPTLLAPQHRAFEVFG
ncbi:MAG: hypothetical protein K0B00_13310 [Rhodobacteraceae bacterium]|nr:hypothetical protein [Paracoccaceae bacterium]